MCAERMSAVSGSKLTHQGVKTAQPAQVRLRRSEGAYAGTEREIQTDLDQGIQLRLLRVPYVWGQKWGWINSVPLFLNHQREWRSTDIMHISSDNRDLNHLC